jgi:protocatechuate 3,4-dioxygenase beta subunit
MLPAAGGDARIDIPNGVQAARSKVVGILQDERTMHILAADAAALPASSAARLSGRVIDGSGKAVAGAMIQACSGSVCVPAWTDAKGAFVFDGLAPGVYSLALDPKVKPLEVMLRAGQPYALSRPIILPR